MSSGVGKNGYCICGLRTRVLIRDILILLVFFPFEIRWRCYSEKYLAGRECSGYSDGAEVGQGVSQILAMVGGLVG